MNARSLVRNPFLLAFLFIHVLIFSVRAEDLTGKMIRISEVTYNIDGNTSTDALNADLSWDFDYIYSSVYELDAYLQQKRQYLINKKVFKKVLTSYEVIKAEELILDVEVFVTLEDSWTIIPMPVYKYDDNLGMVLGLGLDYKNVAGTLTDFGFYGYYSDVKSEIIADWMDVRAGPLRLDFNYNQLWETVKTADERGNVNLEYSYIQSQISASFIIPVISGLRYYAKPILRWPYSYEFVLNNTGESNDSFTQEGTIPAYNQILEWDRVNWIGSLRQGINASIENEVEYDSLKDQVVTWVDGIFKSFLYTPFISYNTRVSAFYYYNDFKRNAGDRLRGILDYKLNGNRGFYWNQNFPFNVLSFEMFGDLQLSPFIDIGFVTEAGQVFSKGDMNYTAGGSLIIFPAILPSFSLGIDMGVNLQDGSETEIRISSQLYF